MRKSNFYIMAMGRSGTTLLQNMLNEHSQIVVPPESFFVLHLKNKYGRITNWDHVTIERFINDVYIDRPFRIFWKVDRTNVLNAFYAYGEINSFQDACNALRFSFSDKPIENISYFGDKNPIYGLLTESAINANPNAKIIHLIRDPRGVASGQMTTFNRKDPYGVGYQWSQYNKRIARFGAKNPSQYHQLKYEDLVRNPNEELLKICNFLDLPYEEKMLEYNSSLNDRFKTLGSIVNERHASTLKPLDVSMTEKWRKTLNSEQIKKIEQSSYETASQFNIEIPVNETSTGERFKMNISKLKLSFGFSLLRIYFGMPWFFRKKITELRSSLYDEKYEN